MKYLNRIRPLYFFFAFILGILYVYLVEPGMKYVNKHPTPENAGKIIYRETKGTNDICYVYDMEKIDCPQNKSAIRQQPIVLNE